MSYGATASTPQINPKPVEPKVYLAIERTFFAWCRLAVLWGSLAVAISQTGGAGKAVGMVWTVVALGIVVYAYVMQRKRLHWIDTRHPGAFDDLVGPVVLCVALAIAVIINFARQSACACLHAHVAQYGYRAIRSSSLPSRRGSRR